VRDLLAHNLRDLAARKGLTQRQVADAVGATPAQVSKWFTGKNEPRTYLAPLAELLADGEIARFYRAPRANGKRSA
jgi:transcriptional regulator with XRE-family HTH domain